MAEGSPRSTTWAVRPSCHQKLKHTWRPFGNANPLQQLLLKFIRGPGMTAGGIDPGSAVGTPDQACHGSPLSYTGEWVRSQSRKASFIRVCQPAPVALKAAKTSGLYRTATCSLSGPRLGPRVRARPTTTPPCLRTAPSQSETRVLGLSGSFTISVGIVFPVDAFFMPFCLSD